MHINISKVKRVTHLLLLQKGQSVSHRGAENGRDAFAVTS